MEYQFFVIFYMWSIVFFIIFIPENICLSNEEIWRYYILLFGDIGGVGTMEYGKYVASGEECDHV